MANSFASWRTSATVAPRAAAIARATSVARHYGIRHLIPVGPKDAGLEAARDATAGDLYGVVVDATGNRHSMSNALQFVAPTGTLVYVGITQEEIAFKHPALHRPEISLRASRNALPADFPAIIEVV